MSKRPNISILTAIVFTAAFFAAFAANVRADENYKEDKIGWITAVVTSEEVYPADPNAHEENGKKHLHLPIPCKQYLPMPFPKPKKDMKVTQPENRTVSYNLITGVEKYYESDQPSVNIPAAGHSSGRASIKGQADTQTENEEIQLFNFGSRTRVTNPEEYPWCVNVKLYISFPSGYYTGSGVLIDPLHVLTVGHNIYEHDPIYGDAWATEITVMPGYEDGNEPYGYASAWATNLYSWSGWIIDENLNHDMGIIELDRSIGALTGWYGFGYNSLCSFFTGNNFYDIGYPADLPYDGEYMYYRYGSFDSCYTYELRFNSQSYHGQSGSGIHHVSTGDRTVYAVLSHGTQSSPYYTDCTRITSNKYFDISDYINSNTPTTFDLMPMDVQALPVVIAPGEQLSSMTYQVHNYSSVSWSGTVYADVYLSTNDTISSYDTLIQTHSFTHTFNPKSSYTVNVSTPPTIPQEFSIGSHWIGVILDIPDYDTSNNDSSGDDAFSIVISDDYTEDFETGDFSSFPWYHSGNADWIITSNEQNSGIYGAKAGTISHNQNTSLEVTLDCISQDIRFYHKVSSESNYDYLEFYIDGVLKGSWSGSVDWSQVSYPVSAGSRTFKWTYSKDGSLSSGYDTAWIDDIEFPVEDEIICPDADLSGDCCVNFEDLHILTDQWLQDGSAELDKLTASDGAVDDHFGNSVSVHENYAIVGADDDDDNGSSSGSAYIFEYDGTSWTQQGKLIASDGAASDYLGCSVSINGDYAVVGASGDDDNGSLSGSAYVFKRDGASWIEQAKLLASDGAFGDVFGYSVSISGDYVIVGAYGDDDNGTSSGSSYIFKHDGTSWAEQAKLTASDGAAVDTFGRCVAIEGDYAIVGADSDDDNGSSSGSAYIFKSDGTSWTQQAKLTASDGASSDRFGYSVSINENYAVIGAYDDDDNGSSSGSAYIFERDGITWVQQAKLTASDGAFEDYFGRSVAISKDCAIVGAYCDDDGGDNSGSAYIFKHNGTSWVEQDKLTASDGAAGDWFGRSVSIGDNYAFVGKDGDDDNGSNAGSVYVFELCPIADLSGDCGVNLIDYSILADQWTQCAE